MTASALFAFLHFVAVFGIFATVFLEWQTMSPAPTLGEAKRMQRCDRWYGLFAVLLLVVGFLRVFYFEKGSQYYFHSAPFIAKLSLFVLIGLLSIYPTIQFLSWRAALKQGRIPSVDARTLRAIRIVIHVELTAIIFLILFAALMARGIGYVG